MRDEGEPEEVGARPKNIPETGYGLRTGEPVEVSSRDSRTVAWAEKSGTMGRGYPHTTDGNLSLGARGHLPSGYIVSSL